MLGKLLSFAKAPTRSGHVTAQLNARVQPIHRGEIYEDPLDAFLREHKLGEVDGGGTMLTEHGEIDHCDVEINLTDIGEDKLALLASTLNNLGAPKGSKLMLDEGKREIPIGRNEGLAIYLNGTDLPDEVYANCDSNAVYSTFVELLGEAGVIQSWWQGPTETALYLYGPSFEQMRGLVADFMASYPLCQKARLAQIA
ncbi:hypothetical protein SAMN05216570_0411 [Dyella sp. OK004]|uniref:hypothetical protein n=1 Tax=Dyella sp. OK004 TaxID=1855292 RepID=UPI0008EA193E|nr:hypothetical protein [Dyella sp. OK004]SFR89716.1 hypothetical protein SAMN05216570_0411 [Dyella sp. OK004]